MEGSAVLVRNGSSLEIQVPSASQFLKSAPTGAYTTTRTGGGGRLILLWERHMRRLHESLKLMEEAKPHLFPVKPSKPSHWDDLILPNISSSLHAGLSMALEKRSDGEELAITTLVTASQNKIKDPFDVHVHIAKYVPPSFSPLHGAHLAVVGPGRDMAHAKSSEWVRTRECLERFRPPSATEFLLSNDGNMLLEGSVTNFFAVIYDERKGEKVKMDKWSGYEVQTAPIAAGVLPGIIRQLIIEICAVLEIPMKESAPTLSSTSSWKEAFITNSLRMVQHVESIQFPISWDKIYNANTWEEVQWKTLKFKKMGMVTKLILENIIQMAISEGYNLQEIMSSNP